MITNIHGYLTGKSGLYYMIITYIENNHRVQYWKSTGVRVSQARYHAEKRLRQELSSLYQQEAKICQLEQWGLDAKPLYLPISSYLENWLSAAADHLCERSVRSYSAVIRWAKAYFDEVIQELRMITPHIVYSYYKYLRTKGLSASTIRHHGIVLHAAFQDACNKGYLQSNPANKIPFDKAANAQSEPYSTSEQIALMQAVKSDPMELPVLLAQIYGLRCGEICGLCWEDVDFSCHIIHIRHNAVTNDDASGRFKTICSNTMKTPVSRRSFPMHSKVERLLLDLRDSKSRPTGSILEGRYGKPLHPNTLSKRFQKILHENGLRRIRFHDMRHGCATELMRRGCDLQEVQTYLGHASHISTLRYIHLDTNCNVKAFHSMERLLEHVG